MWNNSFIFLQLESCLSCFLFPLYSAYCGKETCNAERKWKSEHKLALLVRLIPTTWRSFHGFWRVALLSHKSSHVSQQSFLSAKRFIACASSTETHYTTSTRMSCDFQHSSRLSEAALNRSRRTILEVEVLGETSSVNQQPYLSCLQTPSSFCLL